MSHTLENLKLQEDFFSFLLDICDSYKNQVAVRYEKEQTDVNITYNDMLNHVLSLMRKLEENYSKEQHIGLIGTFNYEWIISFFAITSLGKVVVPIASDLSVNDTKKLLNDSDVTLLCFTDEKQSVLSNALKQSGIIVLEREYFNTYYHAFKIQNDVNFHRPSGDDVAVICYTSGTTGESKGAMLTHRNIIYNVKSTMFTGECYKYNKRNYVPVLPPCHMFQVTVGFLGPLNCGMALCIMNGMKEFNRALSKYRPPLIFLVPAILENMHNQLKHRIRKDKTIKDFDSLKQSSDELIENGIDRRRDMFCSIRDIFGYDLEVIFCGGAKLETRTIDLFHDVGIVVLNGYGITEASPVLSSNTIKKFNNETVGQPLPMVDIKIMNGEICARGPMIFKGYYKKPELTKEVFDGEWFKTGDLGEIDPDGNIVIKGRKKNLIILKDGNNVSPEELENKLLGIEGVSDGMVTIRKTGNSEMLTFVVYLDSVATLSDGKIMQIKKEIEEQVENINMQWPFYKQIKKVEYTDKPFEKTALGKNKRFLT